MNLLSPTTSKGVALDLLERLLAHDRWATHTVFDACATLDDEQFSRSFDIGHGNIHSTFGHLIGNVEYWSNSMQGRETDWSDRDWARANLMPRFDRAYDDFERLAREIATGNRYDDIFTDGWGEPQTYGAGILQVVLHNEGHRTEILHILNRLGIAEIPEIDHALWDFHRRGLVHD